MASLDFVVSIVASVKFQKGFVSGCIHIKRGAFVHSLALSLSPL